VAKQNARAEVLLRVKMGEKATRSRAGVVVEEGNVVGSGILCAQVLGGADASLKA